MDRARVRLIARFVFYVAAVCLAVSVVLAVQVYQGAPDAARRTLWAFILAVVGVLVAMPAGYAWAMAR